MITRVPIKEDFTPETLVLVHSIVPAYGVIIDTDVWKKYAYKENPEVVDLFEEGEERQNLIPVFLFGNVIGQHIGVADGEPFIKKYIQKYAYSNVGGNIRIVSSINELETILYHMSHFFGNPPHSYIESVRSDVDALKKCVERGYDLRTLDQRDDLNHFYKERIKFFDEAVKKHLPNTTYTC